MRRVVALLLSLLPALLLADTPFDYAGIKQATIYVEYTDDGVKLEACGVALNRKPRHYIRFIPTVAFAYQGEQIAEYDGYTGYATDVESDPCEIDSIVKMLPPASEFQFRVQPPAVYVDDPSGLNFSLGFLAWKINWFKWQVEE